MAASPALPGLFFTFAAMVLLIFTCISVPVWNKISFLNVGTGPGMLCYGAWGYTGSAREFGYRFVDGGSLNTNSMYNLTRTLILHPIACGLAGLSFFFGLCGAGYHRSGTVLMSLTATLATIATLLAFILDMVMFGIARHHYRNMGDVAQYGNANWITLGALVALLIGACTAACGVFGSYRRRGGARY